MNYNNKDGCIFCDIVRGKEKAWKLVEDDTFVSFLTPFPNTPGFTVVATKSHLDSYVFSLEERLFSDLMLFAKRLALSLDNALGCVRTGLIIEGMGVDHAHIKLIPMHGLTNDWKPVKSELYTFTPSYLGYLSSHDGARANDKELDIIQKLILSKS